MINFYLNLWSLIMFDSVLKLSLLKHHLKANRLFDITKKIKANWEYFDVNFNEGFL